MPRRSLLWPDPRVKPPYGAAELDWGHPLTQFLSIHWVMNEGGGAEVMDPVRAQHGTLSGATKPGWRASGRGLGLGFDGATSYVVNKTVLNTARVTLAAQFRVLTLPGSTKKHICGFADGDGSGNWEKTLVLAREGAVNRVSFTVYDGIFKDADDTSAIVANQTYIFVGTADAINVRLYRDGVQVGSLAAGASFTGYTVPNVLAGGSNSDYGYLAQVIDWMGVWTEAFPAGHVLWLSTEPYAMYQPIMRRRYFVPTVGTALNLATPWVE